MLVRCQEQAAAQCSCLLEKPLEELLALLQSVIDLSPVGIIHTNSAGKVLLTNHAATEIILQNDGLRVDKDGKLQALACEDTVRLTCSIKNVVKAGNAELIVLNRLAGLRPLELVVRAVRLPDHESSLVILFIIDSSRCSDLDVHVLCSLYGLTPAEAKVSVLLCKGLSVDEIARELSVKAGTVRVQLKAVFSKTGTSRQADLVSLILNNAVAFRKPSKKVGENDKRIPYG